MCHKEMARIIKAVHLIVDNIKIGAYATSHLKCDDKVESQ